MGDELPRLSAVLIGTVVILAVVVPLILLTGNEYFIFALLPGIGLVGTFQGLVEIALSAKRRWVIAVSGGVFIALGVLEAVAAVVKVLHESPWVWLAAIGVGLIGAVIMARAVATEVGRAWLQGPLLRFTIHTELVKPNTSEFDAAHSLSVTLPTARELIGVQVPPFVLDYHQILDEVAEFQLETARKLGAAGELAQAITHSAESAALRRRITRTVLGRPYLGRFADSLTLETYFLDLSGRTDAAVAVATEQIALDRRSLAALGDSAIEAKASMTNVLLDAMTRQTERLEDLGGKPEAEQLRTAAQALGPTSPIDRDPR
ncbi:hypothetical protein [Nocardia sp. NBC_01009]|uniref:hypothetical protein n=1 Tax=Nocardia sp. NBC_01009 TaxID=2975996 RepID=UPI00386E8E58|nr:hypothetical protein OHA42_19085 [Nocardia sp. NBC_01009]